MEAVACRSHGKYILGPLKVQEACKTNIWLPMCGANI